MGIATKQQNKVPELRFSDESWKNFYLGQLDIYVADGNYGEMYPKASQMSSKGIPFIRANNLKNGRVIWQDMKFISPSLHGVLKSGHLNSGDILITTRGEIGTVAFVTDAFQGANINAQICLLRCRDGIDSGYLFYTLLSSDVQKQLQQLQTGSALKQLPKGNLAKVQIPIVSLKSQQKIADFLGLVDSWLDNLRQQKTALETYKRGMMQKLITQQIRFKDANNKDFPVWQEKKISNLFEYLRTNSFSRSDLNYNGSGVQNIHYGDVHTTFSSHFDIDVERVPFANKNMPDGGQCLEKGDVVVADASEDYLDIGKSIEIVNIGKKYIVAGLHTMALRRLTDDLASGYIGHYMKSYHYRLQVMKVAQGAKVLGLSKRYFSNILVPVPTKEEQIKIATFLTSIDETIIAKSEEIAKVEQWKKGLMQKMFV